MAALCHQVDTHYQLQLLSYVNVITKPSHQVGTTQWPGSVTQLDGWTQSSSWCNLMAEPCYQVGTYLIHLSMTGLGNQVAMKLVPPNGRDWPNSMAKLAIKAQNVQFCTNPMAKRPS
jgi:hypothetical protein